MEWAMWTLTLGGIFVLTFFNMFITLESSFMVMRMLKHVTTTGCPVMVSCCGVIVNICAQVFTLMAYNYNQDYYLEWEKYDIRVKILVGCTMGGLAVHIALFLVALALHLHSSYKGYCVVCDSDKNSPKI